MRCISAIPAALLATRAYAGTDTIAAISSGNLLEARMADAVLSFLQPRQSNSLDLNSTETSNGSLNYTQWDTTTTAACMSALSQLPNATNPSGTAVCYNLPSLDNSTGAFTADLRLFQISEPFGDFSGIPASKIQVGVQYNGAAVSPISQQNLTGRGLYLVRKRTITALQNYMFVGRMDMSQVVKPVANGQLEALVMPVVTLTAQNSNGDTVSTNVSCNEAAFINGVFSKDVVLSTTAKAQLAVDEVQAGLANGTVAFVLPGVNILIFPVGLIVTGAWTLIGVIAYGIGTFQRMGYRESYRRRKARAEKPNLGRI